MSNKDLQQKVRQAYADIARHSIAVGSGSTCCGTPHGLEQESDANTFQSVTLDLCHTMPEDYQGILGYVPEADLGLGCGLPVQFARIKEGDVVVDLGSGAGNDACIAGIETGRKGRVIGIDFTPEMVDRATRNAEKLGYNHLMFLEGNIENLPLKDHSADVVISNCVLNLVPNKRRAFGEMFRILKGGGHFSISDIVTVGNLPPEIQQNADAYAGCISGAVAKEQYLAMLEEVGFEGLLEQKLKPITMDDALLTRFLSARELELWRTGKHGVFSIQLFGVKPKKKWWSFFS